CARAGSFRLRLYEDDSSPESLSHPRALTLRMWGRLLTCGGLITRPPKRDYQSRARLTTCPTSSHNLFGVLTIWTLPEIKPITLLLQECALGDKKALDLLVPRLPAQ